jgi:hypothetical protein
MQVREDGPKDVYFRVDNDSGIVPQAFETIRAVCTDKCFRKPCWGVGGQFYWDKENKSAYGESKSVYWRLIEN